MNNKLVLIIKREFNAKVRNKSFIIMTILAPFIMVGMGFLIMYLTKANDSKIKTIAFVDAASLLKENPLKNSKTVEYINLTKLGADKAKVQAEKKEYYGLLIIPKHNSIEKTANTIAFFTKKTPNLILVESLEKKIEASLQHLKLKQLGIDIEKIKSTKIKSIFNLATYSGEKSSKFENGIKIGFGSIAGYLLMMFIMIYGNSVMRSVIEEKTSRIVEIIISSVKPFQLMMGKIIGNALAGLTQFAIWGIMIAILSFVALSFLDIDTGKIAQANVSIEQLEVAKEIMTKQEQLVSVISKMPITLMLILFIIYFLGGFLLYSSLYAAIGSAVDNETDTQQFMMPIIMPLMLGVYVGAFSVINDPHGPVATIFSMIPLTSPIVMLMRVPFGVPVWQIIVSIVLLVGTFIFTVWLAAKIYRIGILMYGKKPTYKELFKWLRY
ncbi:MAG: ABC transporter permease [Flavobacteriaceae bacterium]|nr:ABC transporter permease [Flavobacteriaceae bacterium]